MSTPENIDQAKRFVEFVPPEQPVVSASANSDIVVDAVYEDGHIKLVLPLDLPRGSRVRLHISTGAESDVPVQRRAIWASLSLPLGRAITAFRRLLIDRIGQFPLLLSALALIAGGQYYFLKRLEFSWAGFLLALLAIGAFTLATTGLDGRSPGSSSVRTIVGSGEAIRDSRRPSWRVVALLLATVMMVVLLQALRTEPPLPSYNWGLVLWGAAIGCYLLAVAPLAQRSSATSLMQQWRRWWYSNRAAGILLIMIMLVAFGLRVWQLGRIPPTLGGDEGSQGLEAIRVINGQIRNPFVTGWLGVPTLSFYFNAPTIKLLGNTITALRLPWALVGTATVLVIFWGVRRLIGLGLGLMTAALLATYHYHIHYSRLGSNQIADAFFIALAFLFLYRGYDQGNPIDWALCGVVIGVAQYFYAGARFSAIVVAATTLLFFLRDGTRFWRDHRLGVLIMLGAAVLTAAPMILYALRFPADYNARINEVGIFQNGWLAAERETRHEGTLPILLDQLRRAALAFNAYPDRTTWYGSPQPLFDFAWGALFLLGLGYATLHLADRRLFPMVAWWWGGMIMGGVLTENPPSSQRLITLAPPAVFFVALALLKTGQIIQRAWNMPDRVSLAPYLSAAVLVLGLLSVKWYFIDFTPLRVYGNFNAVVATALGTYARDQLGSDWKIYFFGPPRMYVGFGSIPYLAPQVEGIDITKPLVGRPERSLVSLDKNAAFIFLPERRQELNLIRKVFQGGTIEEMPSPLGGDPLFIIYRVPRTQLAY